jgi:hypothetical protein
VLIFEVELEGDQGVASLLEFPQEAFELIPLQEELAGAVGVVVFSGSVGIRADMGIN